MGKINLDLYNQMTDKEVVVRNIEDDMTDEYKKICEEADERIIQHQKYLAEVYIKSSTFIAK